MRHENYHLSTFKGSGNFLTVILLIYAIHGKNKTSCKKKRGKLFSTKVLVKTKRKWASFHVFTLFFFSVYFHFVVVVIFLRVTRLLFYLAFVSSEEEKEEVLPNFLRFANFLIALLGWC